jgi:hypothetical protein
MFLEHIVYSTAIAVIVGLVAWKLNKPDYSWIIIATAYLPDTDVFFRVFYWVVLKTLEFSQQWYYFFIHLHSLFHTFAVLIGFALLGSIIFIYFGIRPLEGFIYTAIGYGIHLFEDALVYNPGYPFLWPFYSGRLGWGILPAARNWFGIANAETLIIGILILFCVISLRVLIQGTDWLPRISRK